MTTSRNILIAGGTGLIGKKLTKHLIENGDNVFILTRSPKNKNEYKWDPINGVIECDKLQEIDTIINLAGSGIADKRWTQAYKKDLLDSRIVPTNCLVKFLPEFKNLKQYISASGINCYGYENYNRKHEETDAFGNDFLSQLVKTWEESSAPFEARCTVSKVRISVVLTMEGGALPKITAPIKYYIGSPLGSGKQWMPWIHIDDLCNVFVKLMNEKIGGTFNAMASCDTNENFTKETAISMKRTLWAPKVPAFLLKILFGEMSSVVLQGVNASNAKLLSTGFKFKFPTLSAALSNLIK